MMTSILETNDFSIEFLHQRASSQEILPLLANYQMMPQFICESIIDRAISNIECTIEEIDAAYQQFYQRWNLETEAQQQMWLKSFSFGFLRANNRLQNSRSNILKAQNPKRAD